jgi:hypothetical protein
MDIANVVRDNLLWVFERLYQPVRPRCHGTRGIAKRIFEVDVFLELLEIAFYK